MRLTREQAQVKLDLDGCDAPDMEAVRRLVSRAGYSIVEMSERTSPSGTGRHVVLNVSPRPIHPMEVVALQAICGSDPYREAMQMHRARAFAKAPKWMRDIWNVLYQSHRHRHRHIQLLKTHGADQ